MREEDGKRIIETREEFIQYVLSLPPIESTEDIVDRLTNITIMPITRVSVEEKGDIK